MSMNALSGIKSQVSKIGRNLNDIFGFSDEFMATGLRPVYRITTSKDLSSGQVTDYILVNTIPEWVAIKSLGVDFPKAKLSKSYVWDLIKYRYKVTTDFQMPIEENVVVGILMDESPKNIYRYLVDVIFTNVPYETVDGERKWLAEDFLYLGYPVQITTGFIDVDGNFRRHPNEPPISTYGTIPPDFTGILGALTQETFGSGDFFKGTFVGFEYLLSRYATQEPFPINGKEPMTRTLARMLRWLATRKSKRGKGTKITSGEATVAIPILRAMGVVGPRGSRILNTEQIRKKIIMIDMPKYAKLSRRTIPNFTGSKREEMPAETSFREILERVEQLTNTSIYFNEYGRLTISGKPKVREIAAKKYDRIRVHDAIKGSNTIHHQGTIDLSQLENRIIIHKKFSGINAGSPKLDVAYPNVDILTEKDEVSKYYADDVTAAGESNQVYYYDDFDLSESDSLDIKDQMIDYFRYYGMRGTCFMIGNPKIRVDDVLRLSDIRSVTMTGLPNKSALASLSKEIEFTADNLLKEDLQWDSLIEKSFRLKSGIDHFFIWKVVHYIGPDGFKTKVFYTKERDSYRPGSDLLTQHIRRRRRGIAGEFK